MNFRAQNIFTYAQLPNGNSDLCYNWTITMRYNFIALSHIQAMIQPIASFCKLVNNSDSEEIFSNIFLQADNVILFL